MFDTLNLIFRKQFNLLVNVDKTERTTVGHQDMDVDQSVWIEEFSLIRIFIRSKKRC